LETFLKIADEIESGLSSDHVLEFMDNVPIIGIIARHSETRVHFPDGENLVFHEFCEFGEHFFDVELFVDLGLEVFGIVGRVFYGLELFLYYFDDFLH